MDNSMKMMAKMAGRPAARKIFVRSFLILRMRRLLKEFAKMHDSRFEYRI
jgi:hypothetical protein